MARFAVLIMLLPALLVVPARGGDCAALVYTRVVHTTQADFDWKDAAKGGLKGSISFNARRAAQPMVVYLVRDGGEGRFEVPGALSVSQAGARFEPGFAVLVRGQKARFLNDEKKDIAHNVYFLGAVEADLGIFDRGQAAEHEFSKAGEVSVHCSIHKNMDARYFVAPSPAWAVVAADGVEYEIKNVPAGRYKLKTWQRQKRFKELELELTITADQTTVQNLEMTR